MLAQPHSEAGHSPVGMGVSTGPGKHGFVKGVLASRVAWAVAPLGMAARWSYGMKRASMPECTFIHTCGLNCVASASRAAASGSLQHRSSLL